MKKIFVTVFRDVHQFIVLLREGKVFIQFIGNKFYNNINIKYTCYYFVDLQYKPLLVDLTVEEGTRLKVLYGSCSGFHAVDLDSASVYDIHIPKHPQAWWTHY